MKTMLILSACGYVLGSVTVAVASVLPVSDMTYWLVYLGLLLTGLGWGAVEAASNPLVAALYPEEKTHRLNVLHAWWPAGIVVGGLTGVAFGALQLAWQLNLLILIVPGLVLAIWASRLEFPVTERVAAGIADRDMYRELLRSPGFFLWFFCMMLTATAELAPGQWVDLALSNVVGMRGILLLVYVSALMFVMRHFAGPIVDFVSPVGLLFVGSLLAAAGLFWLSVVQAPLPAFLAATLWGVGVCYMWPTMLASAAERYPRGGAFLMGCMGFAGGLAIQFVLPVMGSIFDAAKLEAAGGIEALAGLEGEPLRAVLRYASVESFRVVAIVPLLLAPIFAAIWLHDRARSSAES
jgi:fucose permease